METLPRLKKKLKIIKSRIRKDTALMKAVQKKIDTLTTVRKSKEPKLKEFLPYHSVNSQLARAIERGEHWAVIIFVF